MLEPAQSGTTTPQTRNRCLEAKKRRRSMGFLAFRDVAGWPRLSRRWGGDAGQYREWASRNPCPLSAVTGYSIAARSSGHAIARRAGSKTPGVRPREDRRTAGGPRIARASRRELGEKWPRHRRLEKADDYATGRGGAAWSTSRRFDRAAPSAVRSHSPCVAHGERPPLESNRAQH